MEIKDIKLGSKNKVELIGSVERVVQTGGPTVFVISDGTGNFSLKGFVSPGTRSFPEIEEGDAVKAFVKIGEFQGELEGEIIKIVKLNDSEKKKLSENIEKIQRERAKVKGVNFLVSSPILEKLKDHFIKAATEIRLAIIQGRPIIVRHHSDTDGYCSGFALEKAILPLILKEQDSPKAAWEFFTRSPSSAPFYEITDSIIDTAASLRNVAKFSNKMPLVIIADNGSSPEDLMGIKQGKVHGIHFVVVDHHYFDEDVISKEVISHINPWLVKEDGAKFSAGMLCVELARIINPDVTNISQIPAMAGYADRIDSANKKIVEEYLAIAKKEGYSKELLENISIVIEYVSSRVRFMEVREYIEVLFGEPRARQKALVDLMAPHIRKLDAKGLAIGKAHAKIEKIGNTTLQFIFVEETFPGFGFFPKPGRAVGLVHDSLQKEKNLTNVVSIGIMNTSITLRATDEAKFSVHDLIKFLDKKVPDAFVDGGGHKNAGSITFLPNKKDKIVEMFKEFVRGR